MNHVVFFSGGIGSWAAAYRLRKANPSAPITLLFTDTLMEDPDLYRFLPEAAESVGGDLVTLADGRTPWEVFHDVRFLGNTRADPCSRILKRDLARNWVHENTTAENTTLYVGISWDEINRMDAVRKHWNPWTVKAPLCNPPYLAKHQLIDQLKEFGIKPPRLYRLGFPHNNCGGFCIKAGQAHFALLLREMPDRYREHEDAEERLRKHLDKDISILRDRRGGTNKRLTLRQFRERVEKDSHQLDLFDWGGCGCFI